MIIYHGSTQLVKIPEIRKGDTFLDFGPGFYTTTSAEQAERWAKIKMRRENKAIFQFTNLILKLHSNRQKYAVFTQQILNGCNL